MRSADMILYLFFAALFDISFVGILTLTCISPRKAEILCRYYYARVGIDKTCSLFTFLSL